MSVGSMGGPEVGSTVFDGWLHSGAPWQPLGALHDAWRWVDAATAAFSAGLELQQALWQPWWDAQAQWLAQWPAGLTGLPQARGEEQLA